MQRVKVVKEAFPYGYNLYRPGDVIDMPDRDAELMLKMGRVVKYVEPKKAPKAVPKVEPKVVKNIEEKKPHKKGKYPTRSMTADK